MQSPNKVSDYLETVRKKIHEARSRSKPESESTKTEQDNDLVVEKEDGLVEEDSELLKTEQLTPDDKNVHKVITATEDQLKELCVILNSDWKKLAVKLGKD